MTTPCRPAYMKDLDPYEYRLMDHYLEVDVCYESTRTTAERTHMSAPTVSRVRQKLLNAGLITVRAMTVDELAERGAFEKVTRNGRAEVYVIRPVGVSVGNTSEEGVSTGNTLSVNDVGVSDRNQYVLSVDNESSLLDFDLVSEVSSAPAHEDPPPPAAPLPEKSNLLALWEHPFVAAWWSATPPDKRVTGIDARAGQTIADLIALGASADDVTGLVTDKFKQPRTEYRFGWLVEDMPAYRAQRQFAAAPPKPTGVWAITELPPERPAPDYTPEQRQKLIEDGRRLRGEMLRQFDYAARVGG